jgi:hypothetical protein
MKNLNYQKATPTVYIEMLREGLLAPIACIYNPDRPDFHKTPIYGILERKQNGRYFYSIILDMNKFEVVATSRR